MGHMSMVANAYIIKIKTMQNNTSTSIARAISRKGKEISSFRDLDIES